MSYPTQYVILRDKPGRKNIVYDTAYTDEQVRQAIVRCATHHGRMGSNIRSRKASEVR